MDLLAVIVVIVVLGICFTILSRTETKPPTCPKCKKEYDELVVKSYEYHREHYCPHCGYEFHLTP